MPRKYTNMMIHEETIHRMRGEGKTRKEIADTLGFAQWQIKDFIRRHNVRQRAEPAILPTPKRRGRPRTRPITTQKEQSLRIKELEREVSLLRSFLHAAGRM